MTAKGKVKTKGSQPFSATQEREVRKVFRQEQKKIQQLTYHLTRLFSQATDGATGIMLDLSNMSLGTAEQQRLGNGANPTSYELRCRFEAIDLNNIIRMIIFRWAPDNSSTVPTIANILEDPGGGLLPPYWPYNSDERQLFQVLEDKSFQLILNQDSWIKFYSHGAKKLARSKTIEFTSGATTGTNHIYAFFISDSGAINHPLSTMMCKLNYVA